MVSKRCTTTPRDSSWSKCQVMSFTLIAFSRALFASRRTHYLFSPKALMSWAGGLQPLEREQPCFSSNVKQISGQLLKSREKGDIDLRLSVNKPGAPNGTFPKSFGDISCIHVVESPWIAFGKRAESLEGDWTNSLSITFKWANAIIFTAPH